MLNFREYKVLKQLKIYQDEKSKNNSYKNTIHILEDDFYSNNKYSISTLNAIFQELQNKGYIQDVDQKMTSVHAIEITDIGIDAINNYYNNIFWELLKIIITASITLFIEHIFDIINILKNYLS